jgi:hypothetical protein
MKRPGDHDPEPPGGGAAERLREFLRQRLPPNASDEEIQADVERLAKEETERSQSLPNTKAGPTP